MDWLAERMAAEDHTVSAIHGDQHPDERKRIMKVHPLREKRQEEGRRGEGRGGEGRKTAPPSLFHVRAIC